MSAPPRSASTGRTGRVARGASGPRSLAGALGAIADELVPRTVLADVQRGWSKAVGDAVAAQAQPTAERAGVITVACAASVWAQELSLMAPQIVARLNDAITGAPVRGLRCIAVDTGRSQV